MTISVIEKINAMSTGTIASITHINIPPSDYHVTIILDGEVYGLFRMNLLYHPYYQMSINGEICILILYE